jgi:hypothetical protein
MSSQPFVGLVVGIVVCDEMGEWSHEAPSLLCVHFVLVKGDSDKSPDFIVISRGIFLSPTNLDRGHAKSCGITWRLRDAHHLLCQMTETGLR